MLLLKVSEDYERNLDRGGRSGTAPCVICGRPVKDGPNVKLLRTHHAALSGGVAIVTDAEAETLNPSADGGGWPVGADCLKKNPQYLPYVNGGS